MKDYAEEGYISVAKKEERQYKENFQMDEEDAKIVMDIWENQAKEQEQQLLKRRKLSEDFEVPSEKVNDYNEVSKSSTDNSDLLDHTSISMYGNDRGLQETIQKDPSNFTTARNLQTFNDATLQEKKSIHSKTQSSSEDPHCTVTEKLVQTDVSLTEDGNTFVEWVAIKVEYCEPKPNDTDVDTRNGCGQERKTDKEGHLEIQTDHCHKNVQTLPVVLKRVSCKKKIANRRRRFFKVPNYHLPSLDGETDEDEVMRRRAKKIPQKSFRQKVEEAMNKFYSTTWDDNTDDEEDFTDTMYKPNCGRKVNMNRWYDTRTNDQKKCIDRFGYQLPSLLAINDVTLEGTTQERLDEERRKTEEEIEAKERQRRKVMAKENFTSNQKSESTQTEDNSMKSCQRSCRSVGTNTMKEDETASHNSQKNYAVKRMTQEKVEKETKESIQNTEQASTHIPRPVPFSEVQTQEADKNKNGLDFSQVANNKF